MQQQSTQDLGFVGAGLRRPECVLATRRGELFVSDQDGVAQITPDGQVHRIAARPRPAHFMPNGIALLADGSLLAANLGLGGGVWRLTRQGEATPWLQEVDGQALHPTNFVGLDHQGRIWVTVSSRLVPRERAMRRDYGDGYIILVDAKGARIVAEGLHYTNEAIADPAGRYLYVNETHGRCLSRFAIRPDGLGAREVVCTFEHGVWPDGMAHDAQGGVWVVSVVSNRVLRVDTATGGAELFLDDSDAADVEQAEAAWRSGTLMPRELLDIGHKRLLGNASSLAFGGPDLHTLYIGTLFGERIAHLRAPIAGAAPAHWHF